jgi:hypothetical protein
MSDAEVTKSAEAACRVILPLEFRSPTRHGEHTLRQVATRIAHGSARTLLDERNIELPERQQALDGNACMGGFAHGIALLRRQRPDGYDGGASVCRQFQTMARLDIPTATAVFGFEPSNPLLSAIHVRAYFVTNGGLEGANGEFWDAYAAGCYDALTGTGREEEPPTTGTVPASPVPPQAGSTRPASADEVASLLAATKANRDLKPYPLRSFRAVVSASDPSYALAHFLSAVSPGEWQSGAVLLHDEGGNWSVVEGPGQSLDDCDVPADAARDLSLVACDSPESAAGSPKVGTTENTCGVVWTNGTTRNEVYAPGVRCSVARKLATDCVVRATQSPGWKCRTNKAGEGAVLATISPVGDSKPWVTVYDGTWGD